MGEELTVLGVSCHGGKDWLSVWMVLVRLAEDGSVEVAEAEPWDATKGRDEASQLGDVHDSIINALAGEHLGKVAAVALKRPEAPPSRPTVAYDRKVRFEGVAMKATESQGKRYFAYRKNQLGPGAKLLESALASSGAPDGAEPLEALAAACVALSDLSQ